MVIRFSKSTKLRTHVALSLLIEVSYGPNLEIAYVVGRGWLPLPQKIPTPSPLSALWALILGPSGASIQPPLSPSALALKPKSETPPMTFEKLCFLWFWQIPSH